MLDARELRIGNIIKANGLHEGREVIVDEIGAKNVLPDTHRVIMFQGVNAGEFAKDCDGIELTPEWLLKCGFKKDGETCFRYRDNTFISIRTFGNWYTLYKDQAGAVANVAYVHELQNLFFFIMKEELSFTN